jgi:hypothetical protein
MVAMKFDIMRGRVHTLGGETAAAGDHVAIGGPIGLQAEYVEWGRPGFIFYVLT